MRIALSILSEEKQQQDKKVAQAKSVPKKTETTPQKQNDEETVAKKAKLHTPPKQTEPTKIKTNIKTNVTKVKTKVTKVKTNVTTKTNVIKTKIETNVAERKLEAAAMEKQHKAEKKADSLTCMVCKKKKPLRDTCVHWDGMAHTAVCNKCEAGESSSSDEC